MAISRELFLEYHDRDKTDSYKIKYGFPVVQNINFFPSGSNSQLQRYSRNSKYSQHCT